MKSNDNDTNRITEKLRTLFSSIVTKARTILVSLKNFLKVHWRKILSVLAVAGYVLILLFSCCGLHSKAYEEPTPVSPRPFYPTATVKYLGVDYGSFETASAPDSAYAYLTRTASGKRLPGEAEFLEGLNPSLIWMTTNIPLIDDNTQIRVDYIDALPVLFYEAAAASGYWSEQEQGYNTSIDPPSYLGYLQSTPLSCMYLRPVGNALSDATTWNILLYNSFTDEYESYSVPIEYDQYGESFCETLFYIFDDVIGCANLKNRVITSLYIEFGSVDSPSITANYCLFGSLPYAPAYSPNDVAYDVLADLSAEKQASYNEGRNSGLTESLGVTSWLTEAGDSVLSFALFSVDGTPVTLGVILSVILGSLTLVVLLKLIAGG